MTMEELDLKERIYNYYTLLRKELAGKVKFKDEEKNVKGFIVDLSRPKTKKKTIKWRSKGY